jgi:hypothetical protein
LKTKVDDLKQQLEKYKFHSSFDSIEGIDDNRSTERLKQSHSSFNDDNRSAKRLKSKKGKEPIRSNNDISSESNQDEQSESRENEARVCNFVTLVIEFV